MSCVKASVMTAVQITFTKPRFIHVFYEYIGEHWEIFFSSLFKALMTTKSEEKEREKSKKIFFF